MRFEVGSTGRAYSVEIVPVDGEQFQVYVAALGAEGRPFAVEVLSRTKTRLTLSIDGRVHDVLVTGRGEQTLVDWGDRTWELVVHDGRHRRRATARAQQDGVAVLKAQMPGKVICVLKQEGDAVEAGDGLAVIEAMKMQNELRSPKRGRVLTCRLTSGGTVNAGEVLFEIA